MTLEELGTKLELADDEEIIYCFVDNDKLIATFTTREGLEIEVLTPQERRLLEQGQFTEEDFTRKLFELKQIANFKAE